MYSYDSLSPFNNKFLSSLCDKFNFKQHKSSMYKALVKGLTEDINKKLGNLLKKVFAKNKRDCHERTSEDF